jgi:hypothetical protein
MFAVVLILYTTLAAEFLIRFALDRPRRRIRERDVVLPRGTVDKPMKWMLIAMSAMVTLLLVRSTYRTIELSNGWNGKVISTQWLFSSFSYPCLHAFNTEVLMIEQTCLMVL